MWSSEREVRPRHAGGCNPATLQPCALGPQPHAHTSHPLTPTQVHRFRNMFSHWDDNGDGAISYPEFVAVMKVVTERQGRAYSEKKVQAMFGLADLDRNGVVDFEEFVVMQAR